MEFTIETGIWSLVAIQTVGIIASFTLIFSRYWSSRLRHQHRLKRPRRPRSVQRSAVVLETDLGEFVKERRGVSEPPVPLTGSDPHAYFVNWWEPADGDDELEGVLHE